MQNRHGALVSGLRKGLGAHGKPARKDARCPHCGALERHRLVWLFFKARTDLFAKTMPRKILHFAPERCFEGRLRDTLGPGYRTADIAAHREAERINITDIHYPAASFDVIYCSHVLEHVEDDRKALRELHRVLKPSGWAVILVPIIATSTFEDPSVTDSRQREKLFGQHDHVRAYGPDFIERLHAAGFEVKNYGVEDLPIGGDLIRKMALPAAETVYYCTKSAPTPA